MSRQTSKGKLALIIVNIVLLLGLAGTAIYLFLENQDLNDQLTLTSEEKNKRLVEEINEVYDLPDEEPVVAIVTDPEQFKNEYPVFENAESGDYLLFFRKARLNVLYRQDEKRVVKTADVTVPIAVKLVGSEEAVAAAEKKLSEYGNQITIEKETKDGVTQAFVFDVDGDQEAETKSLAESLGLEIGSTLPSSITASDQTEIVVVVVNSSGEPAGTAP